MRYILNLAVCTLALVAHTAFAADANSAYVSLTSDKYVNGGPVTVLTTTVRASRSGWLFVSSDGRFYPGGPGLVTAAIYVDGTKVSNDTILDWRQTTNGQQHSYNTVGALYVGAGTHTVSLIASSQDSVVWFGSTSNLSAMLDAATSVTNKSLGSDTALLNFDTAGVQEGNVLPSTAHKSIVSSAVTASGPVIVYASGRSYAHGDYYGDAMWGIFVDGAEPNINSMTWSINDLYTGAETQAPMYNQGYFSVGPGSHTFSLEASESPYNNGLTNNVRYKIGANSRLITLTGGMSVVGKGLYDDPSKYGVGRRYSYVCIATNNGNSNCASTGTEVVLGKGSVYIPPTHNGVVYFSARTRIQGDNQDSGGIVVLYLKIDGKVVGSKAVQQLAFPHSASTRTLTASYLATGVNRLAPGYHTAQVIGVAYGNFLNLSMNADLPLIWFD